MGGKPREGQSPHFMGVDLEHWPLFMGTARGSIAGQTPLGQGVSACSRQTGDGSCQGVAMIPAGLDGSLKV